MTVSTNGKAHFPERIEVPARAPVDLHLHTLASDGAWTPSALIDHLAGRGFRVAAVCDHDTQRSVVQAIELGRLRGVHVIPGVEMTCSWNDRQLHILCYGVRPDRTDADAAPFLALLNQIDLQLQENAADAARRIEVDGKPLPNLDVVRAGRPLWPFHVLSAAIEMKHVPNLTKAAELVTALGGSFTADLPLADVVAATHQAGGVCSIAHPGRADAVGIVSEEDIDRILAEVGMDGLEAHYRSYSDRQTTLYRRLADERGMFVSAGSDSHAPHRPTNPRPWHAVWVKDLLARLGVDLAPLPEGEPGWIPGMDPLATIPAPDPPPVTPDPEPIETEADVAAELGKVLMTLRVETFVGGPLETNAYLVFDEVSKQILIIDAPFDVDEPLKNRVSALGGEVLLVVLTHAHWDHIGTTNLLHNEFSAPVAAHPLAEHPLASPESSTMTLPVEIPPIFPDRWLNEGECVPIGTHEFVVMHLPGHAPGHIALYSEPDRLLLSGDVLFPNGHGRIDIPGASQEEMAASLKRLAALPGDVIVYPGHGQPTTIGAEPWLSEFKG